MVDTGRGGGGGVLEKREMETKPAKMRNTWSKTAMMGGGKSSTRPSLVIFHPPTLPSSSGFESNDDPKDEKLRQREGREKKGQKISLTSK
jgi:hypothetical protein